MVQVQAGRLPAGTRAETPKGARVVVVGPAAAPGYVTLENAAGRELQVPETYVLLVADGVAEVAPEPAELDAIDRAVCPACGLEVTLRHSTRPDTAGALVLVTHRAPSDAVCPASSRTPADAAAYFALVSEARRRPVEAPPDPTPPEPVDAPRDPAGTTNGAILDPWCGATTVSERLLRIRTWDLDDWQRFERSARQTGQGDVRLELDRHGRKATRIADLAWQAHNGSEAARDELRGLLQNKRYKHHPGLVRMIERALATPPADAAGLVAENRIRALVGEPPLAALPPSELAPVDADLDPELRAWLQTEAPDLDGFERLTIGQLVADVRTSRSALVAVRKKTLLSLAYRWAHEHEQTTVRAQLRARARQVGAHPPYPCGCWVPGPGRAADCGVDRTGIVGAAVCSCSCHAVPAAAPDPAPCAPAVPGPDTPAPEGGRPCDPALPAPVNNCPDIYTVEVHPMSSTNMPEQAPGEAVEAPEALTPPPTLPPPADATGGPIPAAAKAVELPTPDAVIALGVKAVHRYLRDHGAGLPSEWLARALALEQGRPGGPRNPIVVALARLAQARTPAPAEPDGKAKISGRIDDLRLHRLPDGTVELWYAPAGERPRLVGPANRPDLAPVVRALEARGAGEARGTLAALVAELRSLGVKATITLEVLP